jgi:triphosphoribosyl-dephospho-CoA synthase
VTDGTADADADANTDTDTDTDCDDVSESESVPDATEGSGPDASAPPNLTDSGDATGSAGGAGADGTDGTDGTETGADDEAAGPDWPRDGWNGAVEGGQEPATSRYPWRPSDHPRPEFTPADHAQLALLLEVTGTPKPGNVDRRRDLTELRFEQFLAGGVGAGEGLRLAESGASVGEAFGVAVEGMSQQSGGNTQFGCLLNLVPLVRAAAEGDLSPAGVHRVVEATTVDDAVAFYRAFDHVDVAVADPPTDLDELDVRRGGAAEPALREAGLTLADVMRLSATGDPPDGNAREWLRGFDRSFTAAGWLLGDDGPAPDRIARAFLRLLADEPDTLVWVEHGEMTARLVSARARAAIDHVDVGRRKAAAEIHGRHTDTTTDEGGHDGDGLSGTRTRTRSRSRSRTRRSSDPTGDEGPAADGDDGAGESGSTDPDGTSTADREAVDAAVRAKGEVPLLEFAESFADEFVGAGINPGTTADVTAAATFLALERGLPL